MASSGKHLLISHQPLRLLFQLSYSIIILARLPYYSVISLVPWLRPNPRWSAKQEFMTRIFHPILDIISRVGIADDLTLEKRKEGERFQVVDPAAASVYQGPLASETIKRTVVGGTWFPKAPDAAIASRTVFLYFHGGAFIQGDGRDVQCANSAKMLLAKGRADAVFSVQYRLSGYGGLNPYPAALQDALSSYLFLLNVVHVPAKQIVVAGDSSGGNLATALWRYLAEHGAATGVPEPKCAVLICPWVAPFDYQTADNPHRGTDFIPSSYGAWGAHAYGGRPRAAADAYITPLGNPFATSVPIFSSAGSAELFYGRIVRWMDEMGAVGGNKVQTYHEKDAVHDIFFTAETLGFESSAWEVASHIGMHLLRSMCDVLCHLSLLDRRDLFYSCKHLFNKPLYLFRSIRGVEDDSNSTFSDRYYKVFHGKGRQRPGQQVEIEPPSIPWTGGNGDDVSQERPFFSATGKWDTKQTICIRRRPRRMLRI